MFITPKMSFPSPGPIVQSMFAVIFTVNDLSRTRAERQMAEAQMPHILTAGVILLHRDGYRVAGLEEVFDLLDEGWQQWRLSIMRQIDDEGDLHAEDFLKAVLERIYDSAFFEDAQIAADRWNDERPLLGR